MKMVKNYICTLFGAIGGFLVMLIGGVDKMLCALLLFMAIDYVSGLVVAGIFKASPKTKTGTLKSDTALKGLVKKGMALAVIIVANQLDFIIGTSYIRAAAVMAFLLNELISITENAGLMGVPIPNALKNAIDVLKDRENKK